LEREWVRGKEAAGRDRKRNCDEYDGYSNQKQRVEAASIHSHSALPFQMKILLKPTSGSWTFANEAGRSVDTSSSANGASVQVKRGVDAQYIVLIRAL
jgi:hypothetical protein